MKTKTYLSASATLLALAAFVMVGCETTNITPDPDPAALTISAEGGELTVPADGGDVTVTYEVANPVEDGTVSASSSESWATVTDDDTPGVVTVNVTANDSGAERTATITVTYTWAEGECSDKVDLVQPAAGSTSGEYDHELTATVFTGELYDDMSNNGEANFYTFLSDMPFGSDGYTDSEGTYYLFDIYAPASALETEALPAGTYTLGEPYATEEMTFGIDYSSVYLPGEYGRYLTDGILVVTVEGDTYTFDAVLTDETGATHHVTYTGPAEYNYSPGGGGDEPTYNAISEPVDIEASLAVATYASDANDVMTVTFQFTDMDVDDEGYVIPPGAMFTVEAYLPYNEDGKLALGTYEVNNTYDEYSVSPGYDFYGYTLGSYAVKYQDATTYEVGYVSAGSMSITGSRDFDLYTIECDFTTIEGVSIKCRFEGNLTVSGMPLPYYSTLTGDYTLNISGNPGVGYYYGDYYGTGGGNWMIDLAPSGTGDGMQIDLVAEGLDFSAGIPTGTYTASSYPYPGEYAAGYMDGYYLTGVWYYGYADDGAGDVYISNMAPATSGDLNITNNGNDSYTISFEFLDDNGNTWDGTWEGTLALTDWTAGGYSASSVRPAAKAVAKDVQKAGVKAADVSKIQVRPVDKATASVSKVKKIRLTR